MKQYSLILYLGIFSILSFHSMAQCDCPPLPPDEGTIYIVKNMSELAAAMAKIDLSNGNATVILEDGTYMLNGRVLNIKNNMPNVSFRSKSGDRDAVILKGGGYDGNTAHVFLVSAPNFTLADLTIGWVYYHGVQINGGQNADNPLIQNVRFVNIQEQMLKLTKNNASTERSNNGIVQCCLFEFPDGIAHQYYTGGIDAHGAVDWEVRNNTFKHIRSPESNLAEHAIHFWSNSINTLVENNLIIDCDRGIGFGLGGSDHDGGIIQNNFVHTSRDVGIGLESAKNVKVYNNTVITENYFNSIEYRFDSTYDAHIVNNLTNKNVASRQGGSGTVSHNVRVSDLSIFVDANNHDYHLNENVADIVDEGMNLSNIQYDYDCHNRVFGKSIDIGADEYNSITTNNFEDKIKVIVSVYPNPSYGEIQINTSMDLSVELYSIIGGFIRSEKLLQGVNSFNINDKGIYLLKFLKNEIYISNQMISIH